MMNTMTPINPNYFQQQQIGQRMFNIYIGDLEQQIDEGQLFSIFIQFGQIIGLKICRDNNRVSKGYGFISYSDAQAADNARAKMNHQIILNNPLRVCKKRAVSELLPEANLVIKTVNSNTTINEIDQVFQNFGSIFSSRLLKNGVAFVQFENKEAVLKCLESQQKEPFIIKGDKVEVFQFQKRQEGARTNIYLKNFPEQQTQEQIQDGLQEFCSKFGKTTSILVRTHQDFNNSKFAFVCFENSEDAQKAFDAFQNKNPYSTPLYVNWAETRAERNKKLKYALISVQNETNLFVKNLKKEVDKETLKNAFAQYGEVQSCEVKSPSEGNVKLIVQTKFGFVNFANKDDAKTALLQSKNNPAIRALFFEESPYINFHILKSQLNQYNNLRRNKILNQTPMYPMPQMIYPGYNRNMPMQMPMNFPINMPPQQMMQGPFGMQGQFQGMPMAMMMNQAPRNPQPTGNLMKNMPIQKTIVQNAKQQNLMGVVQQVPSQPSVKSVKEFGSYEQIKKNKEVFTQKTQEQQRTILGELLFPMIQETIQPQYKEYVPKITGMLIDFSVFEVEDILELFEDKSALIERVQEAVDLIQQNSNQK